MNGNPSRVATIAAGAGAAGIVIATLGVAGIQLGLVRPLTGFYLFAAGTIVLGLLALLLGIVGIFLTRGGSDPTGRGRAISATVLGVLLVGIVVVSAGSAGDAPPINDITTNLDDPPVFVVAAQMPENQDRDMSYPADFVPIVSRAYPDLETIRVAQSPGKVFDSVIDAANELGWKVVDSDPKTGVIEAQDTSAIFRFVDDVVVRIRPTAAGGSVVDVRSKSRDGRGDMGANADRIRTLATKISPTAPVATR